MRLAVIAAVCGLCAAGESWAATYSVLPDGTGDFPTIQAAISGAMNGDVIELADGIYVGAGNRDVDFMGKAVTVRSEAGNPDLCIIDCEGSLNDPHRGFVFDHGEGAGSVLRDIGIVHGWQTVAGAVQCTDSSPVFAGCQFRLNVANGPNGAVHCSGGSPTFSGCVFQENESWAAGGALELFRCAAPRVVGCAFDSNHSVGSGGALLVFECNALIDSCLFAENSSAEYGGAIAVGYGSIVIQNSTGLRNEAATGGSFLSLVDSDGTIGASTIVGDIGGGTGSSVLCGGNTKLEAEQCILAFGQGVIAVDCSAGGHAALVCCDVFGNEGGDWEGCLADQAGISGNLSENPLFCDYPLGDLTLHGNSPCAPGSNPECSLIGAWPVSCPDTQVERTTWGAVKAMFRR